MIGTMRAAVVEKPDMLVIKNVPIPVISENEVLIKVKVTGICGTDWSIYTGKYAAEKLPLIPGHEFSGIIAEADLFLLQKRQQTFMQRIHSDRNSYQWFIRRVCKGTMGAGA
jgi:hypothetical protein